MNINTNGHLHMNVAEVRVWNRKPTAKNNFSLVIAFICSSEDLGTWHRSMTHKGISTNTLASRAMTAEEHKQNSNACRLRFIQYKDWPELMEDEWRVTENPDWIQQLITVSRLALTVEQVIISAAFPQNK